MRLQRGVELLNGADLVHVRELLEQAPRVTAGTRAVALEVITARRPFNPETVNFWHEARLKKTVIRAIYWVVERLEIEEQRAIEAQDEIDNGPLVEREAALEWINNTPWDELVQAFERFAPYGATRALGAIESLRPMSSLSEIYHRKNVGKATVNALLKVLEGVTGEKGKLPPPAEVCNHCGLHRSSPKKPWQARHAHVSLRSLAIELDKYEKDRLGALLGRLPRAALITDRGAALGGELSRADLRGMLVRAIDALDAQELERLRRAAEREQEREALEQIKQGYGAS